MPQVTEKMSFDVPTTEVSESAQRVAQRLQKETGPLAVVSGVRLIGTVTEDDIVLAVAAGKNPQELTVEDIGTGIAHVATIGPRQDVDEARRLMDEHKTNRILVVEGGRLLGVISEADIQAD